MGGDQRMGVVVFDAAKSKTQPESGPPVFIERASASMADPLRTDPVLRWRHSEGVNLNSNTPLVDLSAPRGVRFLYRLKGLDPAWKDGGSQWQDSLR